MPFQPGRARTGGRQKGTPNKDTGLLRDMILNALSNAGGVEYLTKQAHENPGAFMTLIGKVLPTQIAGTDGGAVRVIVDTGVPRSDDSFVK